MEHITAYKLQIIAQTYGINGAMAMIQGWGSRSLLDDDSYGLKLAKMEVANMVRFGQKYDDFTDKVQTIGELFIKGLNNNGFTLLFNNKLGNDQGTIWYDYNNETKTGNLVGFYGLYDTIQLHPLQYIEHTSVACCLGLLKKPSFNTVEFDAMLVKLLIAMYKNTHNDLEMLHKIGSVKDRIKHLAGIEAANAIESIFELQQKFFETEIF